MDLDSAAAVTDRGVRHDRNEDDFALAARGKRTVAVVCDGVSSTANPDLASTAAAGAIAEALEPLLRRRSPKPEVVAAALRDAIAGSSQAVAALPQSESGGPDSPPSTTVVAAWCAPGRVVVAHVGDSRAYWVADSGEASRLTRDHSWAEAAIEAGVPEADAYAAPGAHVITGWVGADGADADARVAELEVTEPGTLLLCTDGLWNYFEAPAALAELVARAGGPAAPALKVARDLIAAALDAGGGDNVTAAVVRVGT